MTETCCAPKSPSPAPATSCCGKPPPPAPPSLLAQAWRRVDKVWLSIPLVLLVLAVAVSADVATQTAVFAVGQVLDIAPWLLVAVLAAAYAKASSADRLVARAFSGQPARMVVLAAIIGGLAPFCSCGVVPLIVALLVMGVPVSAVIAFCLAAPIMDPAMFAVTAGVMGADFAIAKTLAAFAVGMIGGFGVLALEQRGAFANPLKAGVGSAGGGCGSSQATAVRPVHWAFWTEADRRATFGKESLSNVLLLGKWLTLAFLLEALMIRYVPAGTIASILGPENPLAVPVAVIVGVPAYLNGYAALPLVSGLVDMGTSQAAAMAFLVSGAVTSIPAAMAVGAIVRGPIFAAYLSFALIGSLIVSLAYAAWLMV